MRITGKYYLDTGSRYKIVIVSSETADEPDLSLFEKLRNVAKKDFEGTCPRKRKDMNAYKKKCWGIYFYIPAVPETVPADYIRP